MIKALKNSSPGVVLLRVLLSALVVLVTYNPTGKSIFHWAVNNEEPFNAWVILGVIVTLAINITLLIAAWKALGKLGTLLVAIFFAAVAYLFLQEGLISTGNRASIEWFGLIMYSIFLGIGISGAIIWRRATGQIVTDESPDIE